MPTKRQQRIKVIKVDSETTNDYANYVDESLPIDENIDKENENITPDVKPEPEVIQDVKPDVKPDVEPSIDVKPEPSIDVKPSIDVEPSIDDKPEEIPKTKTRVQELVDCKKCGKAMTARTLKYYHPAKCLKAPEETKTEETKKAVKDKKKECVEQVTNSVLPPQPPPPPQPRTHEQIRDEYFEQRANSKTARIKKLFSYAV